MICPWSCQAGGGDWGGSKNLNSTSFQYSFSFNLQEQAPNMPGWGGGHGTAPFSKTCLSAGCMPDCWDPEKNQTQQTRAQ